MPKITSAPLSSAHYQRISEIHVVPVVGGKITLKSVYPNVNFVATPSFRAVARKKWLVLLVCPSSLRFPILESRLRENENGSTVVVNYINDLEHRVNSHRNSAPPLPLLRLSPTSS